MTPDDIEAFRNMTTQTTQMHGVIFGVEGQGGVLRAVEGIAESLKQHQQSDTAMFQKLEKNLAESKLDMETKISRSRLESLKLVLASGGMGGVSGILTHLFGK